MNYHGGFSDEAFVPPSDLKGFLGIEAERFSKEAPALASRMGIPLAIEEGGFRGASLPFFILMAKRGLPFEGEAYYDLLGACLTDPSLRDELAAVCRDLALVQRTAPARGAPPVPEEAGSRGRSPAGGDRSGERRRRPQRDEGDSAWAEAIEPLREEVEALRQEVEGVRRTLEAALQERQGMEERFSTLASRTADLEKAVRVWNEHVSVTNDALFQLGQSQEEERERVSQALALLANRLTALEAVVRQISQALKVK